MNVIRQPVSLEVEKISLKENNSKIKHSILLPNNIRCIICGPSNCGKTNVMISLLVHKNGLKYKNVYLYSKTSFQSKYCFLKDVLQRVPEVKLFIFDCNEDVIHPSDALPNSIIIFDDVVSEKQINIRNYFTMGRHKNIDCFYLSQTYTKVPKQLLRDNTNFLIIYKQDYKNLKHIYNEHVCSDMEWEQFKDLCFKIWKVPYNFVTISKDHELNEGRYRKSLHDFITFE